VRGDPGKEVLKGVSRSFYLTLRLLPGPMRGAASLGYLLARTSDTLADTAGAPVGERLVALEGFGRAVAGVGDLPEWTEAIRVGAEARERVLLEKSAGLLEWLEALPVEEAELVREVVRVIVSGQVLDLQRFEHATGAAPVVLADGAALEDYAWRVAGCVGEFWTRLGFLTMGGEFSGRTLEEMLEMGISYGKGLQLVNILRDLPEDLGNGRCYLPVRDAGDRAELLAEHGRWLERADGWVREGLEYARGLRSRRLRAASGLPAMLAVETLDGMRGADWERLEGRVKVPRRRVYGLLVRSFFGLFG
jgi:farnesyl-diphosphate farnesyltransferase